MQPPENQLLASPSIFRLEEHLWREIQHQKNEDPLRPVVVLCGSNLLGRYLARQLAKGGIPHLAIYFLSFYDLARVLARRTLSERGLLPLPAGGKTVLAWKLISGLPAGSYFANVREHPHLPAVMEATFTDIEDSLADISNTAAKIQWLLSSSARKVGEVGQLFDSYRENLTGRFFTETDLLAAAADKASTFADLFGTGRLYVYGFYDLTGAQQRLLAVLAQYVYLSVYLLVDDHERYRFAHSLRDWWRGLRTEERALTSEEKKSDLATVRQSVFTDRQEDRQADGTFRLFSCPNEVIEAREIAREAVRLRREENIPFTEMAVIARESERYTPLLCSLFDKLGLPYYVREGMPLARTGPGKALLSLLRVPERGFRRIDVMDWMTQGSVDPRSLSSSDGVAPVSLWDRLSIEAGVVGSKLEWAERLEALARRLREKASEAEEDRKAGLESRAEATAELLSAVQEMVARLERLRTRSSWRKLVQDTLGLLRTYHLSTPERDEVQEAIDQLRTLDILGERVEFRQFLILVENALQTTSREVGDLQKTGIHVLPLISARHARFRVVFLPGLTDRSFPLAGRQDPILLDTERELLSEKSEQGELPLKRARPQEEKLLFLLALQAAGEKLVMSFPRAEALSGAERVPSYYALRALQCLSSQRLAFADLNNPGTADGRLVYVRNSRILEIEPAKCIDHREFDLTRTRRALNSDEPESARYLESLSGLFTRALAAERGQWGTRELTAYDGSLDSDACHSSLSGLFGPERIFSPTALETYAACPYHFFLQHVLRLEKIEEPETIEEIEPLEKGLLVHDILCDFYGQMKKEEKLPISPKCLPHYRASLDEICRRRFAEAEARGITGYPLMWELSRKTIRQDMERHLLAEIDRGGDWLPDAFERWFGSRDGSEALAFSLGEEVLRLRGKIDRIDRSRDGKRLRVLDYKTGRRRTGKTVDLGGGTHLQLPLYLAAGAQLYQGIDLNESTAEYVYVSRAGEWKPSIFEGRRLEEDGETIREILRTILEGCRQGLFPRCPQEYSYPSCSRCDFKQVGDPRRDILWERKQGDAHLQRFHEMRKQK